MSRSKGVKNLRPYLLYLVASLTLQISLILTMTPWLDWWERQSQRSLTRRTIDPRDRELPIVAGHYGFCRTLFPINEKPSHQWRNASALQFSPDLLSDFDLDLFETNCPTFKNNQSGCSHAEWIMRGKGRPLLVALIGWRAIDRILSSYRTNPGRRPYRSKRVGWISVTIITT